MCTNMYIPYQWWPCGCQLLPGLVGPLPLYGLPGWLHTLDYNHAVFNKNKRLSEYGIPEYNQHRLNVSEIQGRTCRGQHDIHSESLLHEKVLWYILVMVCATKELIHDA